VLIELQCLPENGDRIQTPEYWVLNKKLKQWTMSKNTIILLKEIA
jgi:hypothetical protein